MSNLSTFVFNQSDVRVLNIEGEPWFVAKDVLEAMKSSTTVTALRKMVVSDLGEEFVSNQHLQTEGGIQEMLILSEPGLTLFISRSRTQLGKEMNRWIHTEVLPSIRKTGLFNSIPFKLSSDSTLATFECGDYWVSSLSIAEVFGKRHDNVIRDLKSGMEDLLKFEEMSENLPNFKLTEATYIDSYGRTQKFYKVNRELFNYVVLGYQGDNAKLYRMKFIKAFADLEQQVKVYLTQQMIFKNPNRQQVYILKNLNTGFLKVGITKDIQKRVSQIQNASGCEIEVLFLAPKSDNARDVEQLLHKEFKNNRGIGEWFDIEAEAVIKSLTNQGLVVQTEKNMTQYLTQ